MRSLRNLGLLGQEGVDGQMLAQGVEQIIDAVLIRFKFGLADKRWINFPKQKT